MAEKEKIGSIELLRLRAAWFDVQRAKSLFDAEIMRLGQNHQIHTDCKIDIDTGIITRPETKAA